MKPDENEILKKALRRLYHAAEDFAGSESDMPSHAENEKEFEAAMESTSKLLQERCGGLGRD